MPLSSDDFNQWCGARSPHSTAHPSGASPDHPLLAQADTSGMPTFARLRLQEHVRSARAPFTSNLSVGEFLLTRKLGYQPVAQVIGSSVYHIGRQWLPQSLFYAAGELTVLSHARTEAWQLALTRLEQQAHVSGTHCVVGVHLDRRNYDQGFHRASDGHELPDVIEVSLMGTAVRHEGRINSERPVLSTFSGEEFLALDSAGYVPIGIVYGCCVYYQPSYWSALQGGGSTVARGTQWQNQELTDFTHGFIHARRIAVTRLSDEALLCGAHGILDVKVSFSIQEVEHEIRQFENERRQAGIIATFEAVGTAIVQFDPDAAPNIQPSLSLSNSSKQ